MVSKLLDFIVDYGRRHAHPVNAFLHLIGVPMVLVGLFWVVSLQPRVGLALIVGGYLLQYLGHKAQGNEVGEVTLVKALWKNWRRSS